MQIAAIAKQNAAIQATTLDSSFTGGSASSTQSTGTRVAQAADGRYDVVGAQDNQLYRNVPYGGNARTGLVTTPTLYGERGTELVIDAPTLSRLNMKVPNFNSFVLANRVNQRADGNYAPAQSGAASAGSNTVMLTMIATLQKKQRTARLSENARRRSFYAVRQSTATAAHLRRKHKKRFEIKYKSEYDNQL